MCKLRFLWSSVTRSIRLITHTEMRSHPSQPANKLWLQDCKLPLFFPCLSASLLFWGWSKCHFTTDHLESNLQNIQRGQTKSPRKLSLAAGKSRCFRKCARKGQIQIHPSSGVGFQLLTSWAEGCLHIVVFNIPQESFLISICPITFWSHFAFGLPGIP